MFNCLINAFNWGNPARLCLLVSDGAGIGVPWWPLRARVQSLLRDEAKRSVNNHSNISGTLTRPVGFPSPEPTQDRVHQFSRRGRPSSPGEPCAPCQNMKTQSVSSEATFLWPQTMSSLQIGVRVSHCAHSSSFPMLFGLLFYGFQLLTGIAV